MIPNSFVFVSSLVYMFLFLCMCLCIIFSCVRVFFSCVFVYLFVRYVTKRGIKVPIVPGLMCINAWGGFKKMSGFCRTRVPAELMSKMELIKVS